LAAGDAGEQEIARRAAFLKLAHRDGMRAMVSEWVKGMVHPSRLEDRSLIDSILDMMSKSPVEQFAKQIHALINRPDATPLLPTIDIPALVLCGREDAWATVTSHEEMARLIPRSCLVIVPTCGHMSTLEKPVAVTTAMREWLTEIRHRVD
jgi:pimeloyl-ACP methyl ester carboxylesterase